MAILYVSCGNSPLCLANWAMSCCIVHIDATHNGMLKAELHLVMQTEKNEAQHLAKGAGPRSWAQ